MPTSCAWGKDWAAEKVREVICNVPSLAVAEILDVGPGEGTYADLIHAGNPANKAHITGVEIWAPYITKYNLDKKYNEVIVADIRFINPELFAKDLIIFGDVLEHIQKYDAREVLLTAELHGGNASILVCNPVMHCEFEGPHGNQFDGHKKENLWSEAEMDEMLSELAENRFGSRSHFEKHVGDVVGYWFLPAEWTM